MTHTTRRIISTILSKPCSPGPPGAVSPPCHRPISCESQRKLSSHTVTLNEMTHHLQFHQQRWDGHIFHPRLKGTGDPSGLLMHISEMNEQSDSFHLLCFVLSWLYCNARYRSDLVNSAGLPLVSIMQSLLTNICTSKEDCCQQHGCAPRKVIQGPESPLLTQRTCNIYPCRAPKKEQLASQIAACRECNQTEWKQSIWLLTTFTTECTWHHMVETTVFTVKRPCLTESYRK